MYKNLIVILLTIPLFIITPPIVANNNPKLWLEVASNKTGYRFNESITIALTVLNRDKQAQKVTFSSGKKYDFILRDQSNKVVWQWSAGKMFMQTFSSVIFEPETPKTYIEILDQQSLSNNAKLKPGKYQLTGLLITTEQQFESAPIEIEIYH